jgi:hypothetical protein
MSKSECRNNDQARTTNAESWRNVLLPPVMQRDRACGWFDFGKGMKEQRNVPEKSFLCQFQRVLDGRAGFHGLMSDLGAGFRGFGALAFLGH